MAEELDWDFEKIEDLARQSSVQEEYERLLEEGNDWPRIISFYARKYDLRAGSAFYMHAKIRDLHG